MILLGGRRLSAVVFSTLLAGLFAVAGAVAPAPATASSARSAEACSRQTDNRSSDNWTAADWKICVGNYGGPHGEIDAKCHAGQTIGWNASPCEISGHFEIRKGQEVIKAGRFSVDVPLNGIITARPFRFDCHGNGEYTFSTSGVVGTLLSQSGAINFPRPGYQPVKIADATATVTMC
ncbi:hypothetical protein [Streptomyces sp. NPDC002521]